MYIATVTIGKVQSGDHTTTTLSWLCHALLVPSLSILHLNMILTTHMCLTCIYVAIGLKHLVHMHQAHFVISFEIRNSDNMCMYVV